MVFVNVIVSRLRHKLHGGAACCSVTSLNKSFHNSRRVFIAATHKSGEKSIFPRILRGERLSLRLYAAGASERAGVDPWPELWADLLHNRSTDILLDTCILDDHNNICLRARNQSVNMFNQNKDNIYWLCWRYRLGGQLQRSRRWKV